MYNPMELFIHKCIVTCKCQRFFVKTQKILLYLKGAVDFLDLGLKFGERSLHSKRTVCFKSCKLELF